jgi:hypothetical protein
VVVYDKRLADAAKAAGLKVVKPGVGRKPNVAGSS